MMMKFRDVRVFYFLLSFVLGSSAAWESRPNCPTSCGNITLYYPFGTSLDCAYDERFLIRCNQVENRAFMENSNLQVTDLSLQGEIQILMPIDRHCHNTSGDGVVRSQVSADFAFSSKNRMTVVGCGVGILAQGVRESVYGCTATCNSSQIIARPCSGHDGCCKTPIQSGENTLSLYTFSLTDALGCFYVFIVRDGYFDFFAQEDLINLRNFTSFPVTLDWIISNKTCPPVEESGPCGKKSICINSTTATGSGFSCKCQPGYDGNPYLGCQDIDECKNRKDPCAKDETCKNIAGSFQCKKSEKWKIILLGSIIGFLTFMLGVCGMKLKLEKQKGAKLREKRFEDNGGLMLVQRLLDRGAQSSKPCIKILSDKEIKVATNDLDETRILGKGGQGIVYHGTLSDKTEVAIKKARVGDRDQMPQFINELVMLSQIDHPHVVNLLCCCLETEIPLLVYEYVAGGTLYDKLLGSCLPWEDRLRIAAEIAETLLYLHSFSPTPIVHRDVKPANILLDDKLSAKVSDFGSSRLVPADRGELRETLVQGSFAYLDPEYMQTRTLSEKSDVYAFGVVLMELATGEKPLCSNRTQEHLVTLLESALQEDRLDEVLDTRVVNADNRREIYEAALLGITCTSLKGQERPTMTEIVAQLQVLSPRDCHVGPTSVDSSVAAGTVAELPT